ncbi:MAG: hypothetical protein AMXMBFR53_11250 [Gemmatimonadota bacterium]
MRIVRWLALLTLALPGEKASAQDQAVGEVPEVRVWLDRGDEPVLQRGDRVRIYYHTSHDAFVAIFQIDTDGQVRLLHPRAPGEETFTRGGRDYRLLFPQSSYWFVDEYPGKGYFFIVSSPEPLDLSGFDYLRGERNWDLTRVGRTVYQDPYLAMDDYVARVVPNWESLPYALDFIAYDVGEVHQYPRFLCYDCHGYRSYAAWNPYSYACTSFRVVVWDDPWFYPAYRYRSTRVVYVQPRRAMARFEFKERAVGETWTPLVRTRQPPLRRSVEYVEPDAARPPLREYVPSRRPSDVAPGGPPGVATPRRPSTGTTDPGAVAPRRSVTPATPSGGAARSGAQPRTTTPTTAAPSRRPEPTRNVAPPTARPTPDRPTLQRRPPGTSGSDRGAVARPSAPSRSGSSAARPSLQSRPPSGGNRAVTPSRPSSSSRPTVRPPSRPSGSARPSGSSARPPRGGGAPPPPRRTRGG